MKKLAFFDFCGTLVSFQTPNAFVNFVRNKNGNNYMRFLERFLVFLYRIRIITILNKISPDVAWEKRIKLLQLRGLKYEELNAQAELFYNEMIRPNLINPLVYEMKRLAQEDYEICIISGGYSIYLKYFVVEYKIKHLISTDIAFDQHENLCRGYILGRDCFHNGKLSRLQAYIAKEKMNYNKSISYSDSLSDLPLLLLTGKGVVVSRANSQSWSHKYKFKEIIWDQK